MEGNRKFYYPKYSQISGKLILDATRTSFDGSEMLMFDCKITVAQGRALLAKVERSHGSRDRLPFMHEYQFHFHKIFSICRECNYVTNKRRTSKAWGGLCKKCFRKKQVEDDAKRIVIADRERVLKRYRLHLQTLQGQIHSIPKDYVISNLKIELDGRGQSLTQLAEYMGLEREMLYKKLRNKFIAEEIIIAASEMLGIPTSRFLKIRRGLKNPTKYGIPKFWLEEGFVLPRVGRVGNI